MSVFATAYILSKITVAMLSIVVAIRLARVATQSQKHKRHFALLVAGSVILLGILGRAAFELVEFLSGEDRSNLVASAWISPILNLGAIYWFETLGQFATENIALQDKLRELAATDPLTGAFNRRAFVERSQLLAANASRFDQPLTAIAIDIDHFKRVNDTYGHPAGDEVLKALVGLVAGHLRKVDLFGRLGGEEFAALLPQTGIDKAVKIAQRIRASVEEKHVAWQGQSIPVTISLGIAGFKGNLDLLLSDADKALYCAKAEGRNRVVVGVAAPQA